MSGVLNASFVEPAARQARRFSATSTTVEVSHAHETQQAIERPALETSNELLASSRPNYPSRSSMPITGHTSQSIERVPEVARQNGLQGLIPLSDVRSNYVFDQSPVASPPPLQDPDTDLIPPIGRAAPSTIDSFGSMSLDDAPTTSRNPSIGFQQGQPANIDTTSINSRRSRVSLDSNRRNLLSDNGRPRENSVPNVNMSSALPPDDGMDQLRQELHHIRDMALSSEEKAQRMHALMIADYQTLQAENVATTFSGNNEEHYSESAKVDHYSNLHPPFSPSSTALSLDTDSLFQVSLFDLEPTYHPPSPDEENPTMSRDDSLSDHSEDDTALGCQHYRRNVKVRCADCRRWYTCRHCHDAAEKHALDRKRTKHMLCMLCGHPQSAAACCEQCGEESAFYYCDICKLWDNDGSRSIYHCEDCGICRRGEGLGKDYIHCKKCNVCISINWATSHRCVERATECDCPICGDYMFTSSASVVAMKCGHYIHRTCYDAYMQTSYKCPICNRSAVNMELQWRKLDHSIETQPMPDQYKDTKVWISCNDCASKGCVPYHWAGNKCTTCDSYNTMEVKVINGPIDSREQEQNPALTRPRSNRPAGSESPRLPMHASVTNFDQIERTNSPLPDAIAISAEPGRPPSYSSNLTSDLDYSEAPHSPAGTSTTAVGSPPNPQHSFLTPDTGHGYEHELEMRDADTDSAYSIGSDDDDNSQWGGGPGNSFSMPTIPAGWKSPRLFASNPATESVGQTGTSPGSISWGLPSPSQWGLGSPRFFASRPDEQTGETGNLTGHGWAISPSEFFSSRFGVGAGDESHSPGNGWAISPSEFFANQISARFGTKDAESTVNNGHDDTEDEDNDEDDYGDESMDDSDLEAHDGNGDDGDEEDDEMELPGHR